MADLYGDYDSDDLEVRNLCLLWTTLTLKQPATASHNSSSKSNDGDKDESLGKSTIGAFGPRHSGKKHHGAYLLTATVRLR